MLRTETDNGGAAPRFLLVVSFALALASLDAGAADARRGRAKAAAACAVCHGANGIAVAPNTPNLAGQPATYLEEQLRKYREGGRRHEIMTLIAKPLSDAEISDLAAWFESVRVEAVPEK